MVNNLFLKKKSPLTDLNVKGSLPNDIHEPGKAEETVFPGKEFQVPSGSPSFLGRSLPIQHAERLNTGRG
jgi:hypothetical protein